MNNTKIKDFQDLQVWQEAHKLTLLVYEYTKSFPQNEIFGLTSQIRRFASSIGANISEGFSRQSIKEKIYFYSIACGSVSETHNHTLLARDLGYLSKECFVVIENHIVSTHKLCNALIKSIQDRNI